MICNRCGTNNSKTSKFCRECGNRLIVESLELDPAAVHAPTEPVDDSAVSEVLYEALKLIEHDQLEGAFQKCRQALGMNPASTSARSLLALVYERKAEKEFKLGNRLDAEDYIHAAMRQVERVLEANPGSIADQEKLTELRGKLASAPPASLTRAPRFADLARQELRKVPVPVYAGAGTVVIVFLLILVVFGGGKDAKRGVPVAREPQMPATQAVPRQGGYAVSPTGSAGAYPGYPQQQYPAQVRPQTQPTAPGYGYPPQQVQPQPMGYQQPTGQLPQTPVVQPAVEPVRPIAPVPGAKPVETAARPEPKKTEPTSPAPIVRVSQADSARDAFRSGDYANAAPLFEKAINSGEDSAENNQLLGTCYYHLGRKSEAVTRFERAINLYLDRKSRGEAVEAANAGINTCKQFIELSRE